MSKTVLITGASTGVGFLTAKLFHENGWNVVATMRNPTKSELLRIDSGRLLVTKLDVTDPSTITSAVQAAIAKFGGIDVLVNNAGYGLNGLFETFTREQIQEQFNVNVFGVMDVTRAVLPHFRANKSGGVINISSGAGIFSVPLISVYGASKFALEGYTEALSYELASQNIFVKSVIPHGGISETSFADTSVKMMPKDIDPSIAQDYGPFLGKTFQQYETMTKAWTMPASDVAATIYKAATDGKDKLRYMVGPDTLGLVKARYESKNDEEYVSYIRNLFRDY